MIETNVAIAMSMQEPKRHKPIFKKGYIYDLLKIIKDLISDGLLMFIA